ncbi:MAG: hypothetical protein M9904_15490 [Chitinophagaceae bacterium]|nr:hypothetical protein [Chitinophagaceae bacterium]
MKIRLLLLVFTFISFSTFSQINSNKIWFAKEYSKEIALYNSKQFLFKNILGSSPEVVQFEILPLAAASSGELTTLLYKCDSKKKEGLILGFYGNYWNDAGVLHQGYAFKNLEKDKAIEFLNKIQQAIDNNNKFLKSDADNNNIYFQYDDLDVLIWSSAVTYTIRVFWKEFDSTWEKTAFERSKRRFEKKTK